MTEDEAETKWCPFVRTVVVGIDSEIIGPFNRDDTTPGRTQDIIERALCIGSTCMAWRWDVGDDEKVIPERSLDGHCGLAGKP